MLCPTDVCMMDTESQDDSVNTGTSIMAVEFPDGVVIGADSRTTIGDQIINRVTDKLTKVTDYIYCCRSGVSADTQAVADIVSYQLALHRMELGIGEQPLVSTGARLFRKICYQHKNSLMVSILLAGWDPVLGGQVYSIPIGGMSSRTPVSVDGSGADLIYGYVDANYKPGMSKQQAMEFVTNSLALAISRDISSGGVIRLAVITRDGVERKVILGVEPDLSALHRRKYITVFSSTVTRGIFIHMSTPQQMALASENWLVVK